MKENTILYITPGPVYRPRVDLYQDHYKGLSKSFQGYIFTTSNAQEEITIGRFNYLSMKTDKLKLTNIRFVIFCIKHAIKLSKQGKQIDLVDSYDPLKTGLIGLVVSKILRAKFVSRVNGVYTSPAEWVDEPKSLIVKIKKNVYPIIMKIVLKRADGIKLLFDSQIDPFKNILSGKVIKSFPNYVDTDSFHNMDEDKEILFVGFPFKRKGADIAIEAFKKVADKYPDWKLKILGWYPDTKLLNHTIAGHPQIYHKKPMHHYEMPEQIGRCAILVLPSRSEAMGRVLVEAMAAGKPRIGSNVDGIPTVINNEVDGLLVEPGDIDDLADKLDRLMGDSTLRKVIGNNAQKRASTEFTKENYYNNVKDFYNAVINN